MQTENHIISTETEKLYDLCMIEKFCRGNQEQVKKMLQVFISNVPACVEELKAAYSKGNLPEVKKMAHQIKSTLGYYAVVKMEKDMRQIEELAGDGAAGPELEQKIERLEKVTSQIVLQMTSNYLYQ